jgi:hypothetical protein
MGHKQSVQSSYRSSPVCDSRAAWQILFSALLLAAPACAQIRGTSPSLPTLPSGAPVNARQDYDIPKTDPAEEERRLRALNAARQKRVVSDTNKLLKLTNELNADIARANSDSLTRSQLRKLAEIEKLARDLKTNMTAAALPASIVPTALDPGPH